MAPARDAYRIYTVLALGYVVSQFFRVSNAVIAPELMRSLALSPEQMGAITGVFFLAFGIMQLPTGVLLDRLGPRRTMAGLLLIAAVGSAVFALGSDAASLSAGRALIGVGCAAGLMGAMVVIARWFRPGQFAPLSSLLFTVGGAGILLATTPLAWLAGNVGWRGAFWIMTGVTVVTAAVIAWVVRDAPPAAEVESAGESLGEIARGLREVLANRQLWHVCAIQFVNYATVLAIAGLWAGPYLNDVHGLDGVVRGNVLLVVNVSTLAGVMLYSAAERWVGSRKWTIAGGAALSTVVLAVLALVPGLGLGAAVALLIGFGLVSGYVMLNHAHARALLPDRLVGRGLTLQNLAVFFGVAAMQSVTGLIMGRFAGEAPGPLPEVAYQAVFAFLAVATLAAAALYLPVRDVRPEPAEVSRSPPDPAKGA